MTLLSYVVRYLVIHPDKTSHARAPDAFDLLKKVFQLFLSPKSMFTHALCQAESELSDTTKREELDAVINQARITVLKALSLPLTTPSDSPQLKDLAPSFKVRLRTQSKELLIDEELRRRKLALYSMTIHRGSPFPPGRSR